MSLVDKVYAIAKDINAERGREFEDGDHAVIVTADAVVVITHDGDKLNFMVLPGPVTNRPDIDLKTAEKSSENG